MPHYHLCCCHLQANALRAEQERLSAARIAALPPHLQGGDLAPGSLDQSAAAHAFLLRHKAPPSTLGLGSGSSAGQPPLHIVKHHPSFREPAHSSFAQAVVEDTSVAERRRREEEERASQRGRANARHAAALVHVQRVRDREEIGQALEEAATLARHRDYEWSLRSSASGGSSTHRLTLMST